MRILGAAGVIGLMVAASGCNRAEQQKTQADTQAAAQQVKSGAEQVGHDVKVSAQDTGKNLKTIAQDKDVTKAEGELRTSVKDLGAAIKKASKEASQNTNEPADQTKK